MDVIALLRHEIDWAHQLLEMVMDDVTSEQAHWLPPGIANPLGATYAHAVVVEDGVVRQILMGETPLYLGDWVDRTGISEPRLDSTLEWARTVRVDLPQARAYARAVYASTEAYLAALKPGELDRVVDLTAVELGQRPLGWALEALVIAHLHNMCGEISCLKGLQGARGYPF